MPITQDRLITLISITKNALDSVKNLQIIAAAIHGRHQQTTIPNALLACTIEAATSIIDADFDLLFNAIQEIQTSTEDYLAFREEQIHFKYNAKKNAANRRYQARTRGKRNDHQANVSEQSIFNHEYQELEESLPTQKFIPVDERHKTFIKDLREKLAQGIEINVQELPDWTKEALAQDQDDVASQAAERFRRARLTPPAPQETPNQGKEGESTPQLSE